MGKPIATKTAGFLCVAFPDVCRTQVGNSTVPIPYPNLGDLKDAENELENVFVQGKAVVHTGSEIPDAKSTGDEAGTLGSVRGDSPGSTKGKITFPEGSPTVSVNGKQVVRMFDSTKQNNGNANGFVLGGNVTVFVGD